MGEHVRESRPLIKTYSEVSFRTGGRAVIDCLRKGWRSLSWRPPAPTRRRLPVKLGLRFRCICTRACVFRGARFPSRKTPHPNLAGLGNPLCAVQLAKNASRLLHRDYW